MFFVLSKLLDIFLSPLTWGVLLILAGVARPGRAVRFARLRRPSLFLGIAVLLVSSLETVNNAILWKLEHEVASSYRPEAVYDAVVLLGGIVDERVSAEQGGPSYNDNVERLVVTHRLLRDGKAKVAILSGGPFDPALARFGEARVLADQLRYWGIDESRLILEDRSRNTRENAVYTQEILAQRKLDRVLVVTSAFHMPRARECFYAVGLTPDVLPVDFRAHEHARRLDDFLPRAAALAGTTAMIREWSGRTIYRFQGYAKSHP